MATQDRDTAPQSAAKAGDSRRPNGRQAESVNESSSELDRVREILFGERARDHESRLEAVRSELLAELQKSRSAAESRMDSMEKQWKAELAELSDRLENESEERKAGGSDLSSEIAALSARMEAGLRDLRSQADSSLQQMAKKLESENAELRAELGARSRELSENKADRGVLSELLTDLASRLQGGSEEGASAES